MALKHVGLESGLDAAIELAAKVFLAGGVVVFPTETVYGIGALAGNADAMAKLRRLKGREDGKPFQYLIPDLECAAALGARLSPAAERLAAAYWPGALTVVVDNRLDGGTIGLRMPDSDFIRRVAKRAGGAIVASSANPPGAPAPTEAGSADAFGDAVDLLVDGGPCGVGVASSVVRISGEDVEVLRAGAIGVDELIEAARKPWPN